MTLEITNKIKLLEDLYYWRFKTPVIKFSSGKTYTFPPLIAESILNQGLGVCFVKMDSKDKVKQ